MAALVEQGVADEKEHLEHKSEDIDRFHLSFDFNEFRKIGMKYLYDQMDNETDEEDNDTNDMNDNNQVESENIEHLSKLPSVSAILENSEKFDQIIKEWQNITNTALNNQTESHCQCNLRSPQCLYMKRLLFILRIYHDWCDDLSSNQENDKDVTNMTQMIENLTNYNEMCLINDYFHMLEFHSNTQEMWEFIGNQFGECDLQYRCKLYLRNHRNRENFGKAKERKLLYDGYITCNDVINIQFLDRLHAYLLHSNMNIKEANDLHENVEQENENQVEQQLQRYNIMRKQRQKQLENAQINLANNSKFVTEIKSNNDEASKSNDSDNPTKRREKLNEYSFGATFKYWDHFNHKKVFCIPKYKTLKDEMLGNTVYRITKFQWFDTLHKALQIKLSYKGKALIAINRGGTNNHYSIPYKMPISLSHIMVILFYCNFDSLQRKFKQQCRPMHKRESRVSLNQRNKEIGHWFSLLKEVCWFYGTAMRPGDVFYHGINRTLLFSQFQARFRFPLSTTRSLKEAALFANLNSNGSTKSLKNIDSNGYDTEDDGNDNNEQNDTNDVSDGNDGIILELGYCELCFYIDVVALSDFPSEQENLFFGADLSISNIYYKNQSYKKFISALTLFQSIINGRFFVDILDKNRIYQMILLKMINRFRLKYEEKKQEQHNSDNQMRLKSDNSKDEIPRYIQDLFEYFYLNQSYVWIIKSQLKHLHHNLREYFVPTVEQKSANDGDDGDGDGNGDDDCDDDDVNNDEETKVDGSHGTKQYRLNLGGKDCISYPLKYCAEYVWDITDETFVKFKTMKNGQYVNCADPFRYEIVDDCVATFQCSSAPSKTGKHSFFMKVEELSNNLDKILFGVDLYCPVIRFKTSVPRRWFKESDYLGYTMFDSKKLKNVEKSFQWIVAIKVYDYKRANVIHN